MVRLPRLKDPALTPYSPWPALPKQSFVAVGCAVDSTRHFPTTPESASGRSRSPSTISRFLVGLPTPLGLPGKRVHGKPCREFESRPIRLRSDDSEPASSRRKRQLGVVRR